MPLGIKKAARTCHWPKKFRPWASWTPRDRKKCANQADELAWARARRPKACKLIGYRTLAQVVAAKLRSQWSPEQIAGWLKNAYAVNKGYQVSHETSRRTARTPCGGRRHRSSIAEPRTCARCNCCWATRSWRARFATSVSKSTAHWRWRSKRSVKKARAGERALAGHKWSFTGCRTMSDEEPRGPFFKATVNRRFEGRPAKTLPCSAQAIRRLRHVGRRPHPHLRRSPAP